MLLPRQLPLLQQRYFRSLDVEAENLSYADSLNIEQYNLFQAHSAVKADDGWLIVSSSAGDYNLLFINLSGPDAISAFHGIDADDETVYVIYSGHKMWNDVLPSMNAGTSSYMTGTRYGAQANILKAACTGLSRRFF